MEGRPEPSREGADDATPPLWFVIAVALALGVIGLRAQQFSGTSPSIEQERLILAERISELEIQRQGDAYAAAQNRNQLQRLRVRLAQLETLHQKEVEKNPIQAPAPVPSQNR